MNSIDSSTARLTTRTGSTCISGTGWMKIKLRIEAPHFVAGCSDGKCAPIIKDMEHWPIERIASYCKSKGWSLVVYPDRPTWELKSSSESYRFESLENEAR